MAPTPLTPVRPRVIEAGQPPATKHLVEENQRHLVEEDPAALHRQAVLELKSVAVVVTRYASPEELGSLAAAVRAFVDDPKQAPQVDQALWPILKAHPEMAGQLPRVPAFMAVVGRYRQPTQPAASRPAAPQQPRQSISPEQRQEWEERDRSKMASIIAERQRNKQELADFYADPEYKLLRDGANDNQLSDEFLLRRKRLFGKRSRRRLWRMR